MNRFPTDSTDRFFVIHTVNYIFICFMKKNTKIIFTLSTFLFQLGKWLDTTSGAFKQASTVTIRVLRPLCGYKVIQCLSKD